MNDEPDARLDEIAKRLGLKGLEDITVEKNEGAPDGYGYGAWVGEFDMGCKVGTGRTPEEAIEDLLDQLSESDANPEGPGAYDYPERKLSKKERARSAREARKPSYNEYVRRVPLRSVTVPPVAFGKREE